MTAQEEEAMARLNAEMEAAAAETRAKAEDPAVARTACLNLVFNVFDLDNSGTIETSELLELGQMRRKLGQKQGDWSDEKNAVLITKMDANGDGVIQGSEFAEHFEKALPADKVKFEQIVKEFMEVAKMCRDKKQEQRESQPASVAGSRRASNANASSAGSSHASAANTPRCIPLSSSNHLSPSPSAPASRRPSPAHMSKAERVAIE